MTRNYRFTAALATVALAVGATTAFADGGGGGNGNSGDGTVLDAGLFGSRPAGPVLFGVKPGGAPWVLSKGEAKVRRDGRIDVRVEGLVIPTPPQNGTNPLSALVATVYCGGMAVGTTHPAAFSASGNARIDETLPAPLPSPCLAPTVLINPANGGVVNSPVYIAASGE